MHRSHISRQSSSHSEDKFHRMPALTHHAAEIPVEKTNGNVTDDIQWTEELETLLLQSFISDTCIYRPVGIAKHFNMLIAYHRFIQASDHKDIHVDQIWQKLRTFYELDEFEKVEPIPFPHHEVEFSLPDNDFHQLMSERSNKRESLRDPTKDFGKDNDEFSTPPPLAIEKRTTGVKRKATVSESSTGSSGRKSVSSNSSGSGSAPTRRKLR